MDTLHKSEPPQPYLDVHTSNHDKHTVTTVTHATETLKHIMLTIIQLTEYWGIGWDWKNIDHTILMSI